MRDTVSLGYHSAKWDLKEYTDIFATTAMNSSTVMRFLTVLPHCAKRTDRPCMSAVILSTFMFMYAVKLGKKVKRIYTKRGKMIRSSRFYARAYIAGMKFQLKAEMCLSRS